MRSRAPGLAALTILVLAACGLPRKEDMDLAQSVYEMGQAVQDLQQAQLELTERVDSLARLVTVQDSALRLLANLSGNPLPPR